LNHGRIDVDRLRTLLAGLSLPRFDGGRLVLAVDVSPWLRSDAPCSAERLFCHVYGRAKTASQFIPGWPYSFVAVLEPGATSWTAILDAVRLGPADDATAITAAQLRRVVERLIAAGQRQAGDPDIVIISDAGYDVTRLAWVLRDLPVELVGRVRSDRVMRLPKPPRMHGVNGRPPKHGPEFRFTKPETWPEPAITTVTDTTNYGKAETQVWVRVHPWLTHRSSWLDHDGELPLVEGTLMRLKVEHLSKDRDGTAERLRRLLGHCPELRRTHDLVRQFAVMLDTRDAAPLPDWLDQLTHSQLAPLAGIATALREDQHAVAQGITTPYNSGVNEGRITDVKLPKRIMAGRAGVPLLRQRVVLIAHLRRRYADRPTPVPG
jgi:hypothetical protein